MPELTRREKHLAFAGILMVLFLASLNMTVVGTALPRIIAELQGFNLYAWAFTSFSLSSTVTLPVYGRLSDIYGRKGILLFGIVMFTLSSVLCGFSQNMPQLIAFRTLQGIGGGALMSMALAVIGDIFTPRERGRYQGFNGAVFGISSVIGPLVGGVITDTLGWRWVFFVNVPVALLAFMAIVRYVPRGLHRPGSRIDFLGTLLLIAGVVPLLLALTWGGSHLPWASPTLLALLAGSVLGLVLFAWQQTRSRSPVLAPELFRDRTFVVSGIAGFLTGIGLFGAIIYLPLYIQGVQAASAAASGFALTPLMFGMILSSTISGIMVTGSGRYKGFIVAGLLLMVVGFYLAGTMGPQTPIAFTVAYMVILGIGLGPTNALYLLAVQNALPPHMLGTVTSASQFFRQIGGTIGVTLFGALITARITASIVANLPPGMEDLSDETLESLADPNLLTNPEAVTELTGTIDAIAGSGVFATFLADLRLALSSGLELVFLVSLGLTVLALLITFFLPDDELLEDTPALDSAAHDAEGSAAGSSGSGPAVSTPRSPGR